MRSNFIVVEERAARAKKRVGLLDKNRPWRCFS